MRVGGADIDTLGEEILRILDGSDGGAKTTSEVREELRKGGFDLGQSKTQLQNRRVKRRFGSLQEAGLVEVRPGGTGEDGRTLPKEAKITSEGREIVETYGLHDTESAAIAAARQQEKAELEQQVQELKDENARLENELNERMAELEQSTGREMNRLDEILNMMLNEVGGSLPKRLRRENYTGPLSEGDEG